MEKEEVVNKLLKCADFKSQFTFLEEDLLKKELGETFYKDIYNEFFDHWSYELSERLESIDLSALISAAVNKAIEKRDVINNK